MDDFNQSQHPNQFGAPMLNQPSSFKRWLPTIAGIVIVVVFGGAILAYQYYMMPQAPANPTSSPSPIVSPSPISAPDETMNWKTYRDEAYDFGFKYPLGWTVDSSSDSEGKFLQVYNQRNDELLGLPHYTNVYVAVTKNKDNIPFTEWYKSHSPFGPNDVDNASGILESLKIIKLKNGNKGYFLEEPGDPDVQSVFFSVGKSLVKFSATCFFQGAIACKKDDLPTIERKILESFVSDNSPTSVFR